MHFVHPTISVPVECLSTEANTRLYIGNPGMSIVKAKAELASRIPNSGF